MKAPLVKNQIGTLMSTAAEKASIQLEGRKVTNHAVRKTCISCLLDANIPENYVAQLSGHKKTESLQAYKTVSLELQQQMSLILSRAETSPHETSSSMVAPLAQSLQSMVEVVSQVVPATAEVVPLYVLFKKVN